MLWSLWELGCYGISHYAITYNHDLKSVVMALVRHQSGRIFQFHDSGYQVLCECIKESGINVSLIQFVAFIHNTNLLIFSHYEYQHEGFWFYDYISGKVIFKLCGNQYVLIADLCYELINESTLLIASRSQESGEIYLDFVEMLENELIHEQDVKEEKVKDPETSKGPESPRNEEYRESEACLPSKISLKALHHQTLVSSQIKATASCIAISPGNEAKYIGVGYEDGSFAILTKQKDSEYEYHILYEGAIRTADEKRKHEENERRIHTETHMYTSPFTDSHAKACQEITSCCWVDKSKLVLSGKSLGNKEKEILLVKTVRDFSEMEYLEVIMEWTEGIQSVAEVIAEFCEGHVETHWIQTEVEKGRVHNLKSLPYYHGAPGLLVASSWDDKSNLLVPLRRGDV